MATDIRPPPFPAHLLLVTQARNVRIALSKFRKELHHPHFLSILPANDTFKPENESEFADYISREIHLLSQKQGIQSSSARGAQAGWRNIISSKLDTPKDLNLSSFLERALWVHPDGQNNIVQLVHRFDLPRPSSHQLHVTKSDQTRLRFL